MLSLVADHCPQQSAQCMLQHRTANSILRPGCTIHSFDRGSAIIYFASQTRLWRSHTDSYGIAITIRMPAVRMPAVLLSKLACV